MAEKTDNFWLRELKTADGIDIDEYLDYLFGSFKYDTGTEYDPYLDDEIDA